RASTARRPGRWAQPAHGQDVAGEKEAGPATAVRPGGARHHTKNRRVVPSTFRLIFPPHGPFTARRPQGFRPTRAAGETRPTARKSRQAADASASLVAPTA